MLCRSNGWIQPTVYQVSMQLNYVERIELKGREGLVLHKSTIYFHGAKRELRAAGLDAIEDLRSECLRGQMTRFRCNFIVQPQRRA